MKLIIKSIVLITLLIGLLSSTTILAGEFIFEMEDSLSFEETIYVEQIRSADGKQGLVDSTRSFYQRQFIKTPIGYDLISKTDSIVALRNGRRVTNPITEAMARVETRMILDYDGHAFSVEGFEQLTDILAEDSSAESKALIASLKPRIMAEKEATEWNNIIDPLIGAEVKLGVVAYYTEEMQVNAATRLSYFTVMEVVDTFRVEGQLSARIYIHADTELARLAERRKLGVDELGALFPEIPAEPDLTAPESRRLVQLVIEVETMKRIGLMVQTEIVIVTADEKGQSHYAQLRETRDSRVIYKTKETD